MKYDRKTLKAAVHYLVPNFKEANMINFKFELGDVMDTTNWTEEMVQEVLDELSEQDFGGEGLDGRWGDYVNIYLDPSASREHCLYFSRYPFGYYPDQQRNLTWEYITKSSKPEDTDMEDTTNSELPPISEWRCFKEVAKVLGEEEAHKELDKIRNMDDKSCLDLDTDKNLFIAFCWRVTPQGGDFWCDICNGDKPEVDKPATSSEKATEALATSLGVSPDTLTETFQAKLNEPKLSIGELLKQLYYQAPSTNISFMVQSGNEGEPKVSITVNDYPTLDVTKLTSHEIDKVVESLVILLNTFK